MSARFNEILIANSYHTLWEAHFAALYKKKRFAVYIPYTDEVHVGFDLGFAIPSFNMDEDEFFDWMKDRVQNPSSSDSAFLMGYFYQYKILNYVPRLSTTRNKSTKEGLIARGYSSSSPAYRVELYTERKLYQNKTKRRPFSQHEALCRLAKVKGAEVFYCAPQFLMPHGIPDLSIRALTDLTLVQVTDKVPTYDDQETHYIYFQTITGANAQWCSRPIPAHVSRERDLPPLLTPKQLLQLMKANYMVRNIDNIDPIDFKEVSITNGDLNRGTFLSYLRAMPECTRFVAFTD